MGSHYICNDWQLQAGVLPYIRQFYPQVTRVYWCRPFGGDRGDWPTDHIRTRSRGKHSPGSGNYSCTQIYAPGGITGFIRGTYLYCTHLDSCYAKSGMYQQWYELNQSGFTVEKYWQQSNSLCNYQYEYYYDPRESANGVTWRMLRYQWGDWGWPSKDRLKAIAFTKQPTTSASGQGWAGHVYFGPADALTPKSNASYLADMVQSGAVPNLSAYLNQAYTNAFASMPAVTTNNIANIFSIYNLLKSLVSPILAGRSIIEGVGSLGDAWLGYRYEYSTTKMDIQELAMYVDRMRALRNVDHITGHGVVTRNIGEESYVVRCSLQASPKDLTSQGIYNDVEALGLALDGYNAWDLIPYSFIVDWFFRIGDKLEVMRSRNYASRLSPTAVWYSITHDYTNPSGCHQCDYYRWNGGTGMIDAMLPSSILGQELSSNSLTWVKRGADALALLT